MATANEGGAFLMAAMLIESPRFAVLKASGINRDDATKAAVEAASGRADIVHIGAFLSNDLALADFQGLIIPGGFSYGDDIQAGVVLALEMRRMQAELEEFALTRKRPIIGVCNGFQALVQSGLLPFGEMTTREYLQATLTTNARGRFESRWIYLKPEDSCCLYIRQGDPLTFPVAHGEGRFVASYRVLAELEAHEQVVYRYCDTMGNPTQEYPANPNGSLHAIAGITDPTGVILGMMPHAEDFVRPEHKPNWRRDGNKGEPDGLRFYKQVVLYAAEL